MRIKIQTEHTNIGLQNSDANFRILDFFKNLIFNELKTKIIIYNIFNKYKILTKEVNLDIYDSSLIDLVKNKIESLDLPMIYKVDLLNLLDDKNFLNKQNIFILKLEEILYNNDLNKLEHLINKELEYFIRVEKITENDVNLLFNNLFGNTKYHNILIEKFKSLISIGFIANKENYYYEKDIQNFLTDINNYKNNI